jgi:very-short-patch-repair endonuclease
MQPQRPNARPRSSAWPDAAVTAIAGGQRTIVTHAQLRALGISRSAIHRATTRGRLWVVHHGVYSIVVADLRPPLAAEQAAVLASGSWAVLSHTSAAVVHGLRVALRWAEVHLTVPGIHRHSRAGLVVHRATVLHPDDHHRLHRLPVTSVARTVLDLAPHLSDAGLEHLLDQALRRTSRAKLVATLERHPRRPGAPRLRALLDPRRPSADTWSAAEQRLLALIRRAGLPAPEANVAIEGGRYIPDLLWRAQRVIVEYDSEAFHSGSGAIRRDTARHNALTALGYLIIHVTGEELRRRPERILVQIAAALALRS